MLTQVAISPVPLDDARPPALMTSAAPPTLQTSDSNGSLARFFEGMQEATESLSSPIAAFLDPSRQRSLSTAELLTLQVRFGEYTTHVLMLSHISQSIGSSIQSLTQRT